MTIYAVIFLSIFIISSSTIVISLVHGVPTIDTEYHEIKIPNQSISSERLLEICGDNEGWEDPETRKKYILEIMGEDYYEDRERRTFDTLEEFSKSKYAHGYIRGQEGIIVYK